MVSLCASLGLALESGPFEKGKDDASMAGCSARTLGLICLVLADWGDGLFTALSKRLSWPVSAALLSWAFLRATASGLQMAVPALILVGFVPALVPKKPRGSS